MKKLDIYLTGSCISMVEVEGLRGGTGKCTILNEISTTPISELGVICLEKSACIGFHTHNNDKETYTLLKGRIECNGIVIEPGQSYVCEKGSGHDCRNVFDGESIIRFSKEI